MHFSRERNEPARVHIKCAPRSLRSVHPHQVMAIHAVLNLTNYSCYYFALILALSLTVISCNNLKCRQSPCPPANVGVPQLKQIREPINNDLSPIMDSHLTDLQGKKVYKDASTGESTKHKYVPEYMLDIYAQKMQRSVAGKSFDNVRNYRAIPGYYGIIYKYSQTFNFMF